MKIFNYIHLILASLLLINLSVPVNNLHAATQAAAQNPFMIDDMDALRQEVADVQAYLQTLSPEEQAAIEEEALRMIESMPADQREQFLQLTEQIAQPTPPVSQAPTEELTPQKEEKTKNISEQKESENKIKAARKVLTTLIETFESIEIKIASLHRVSKDPNQEREWQAIKTSMTELISLLSSILNPVTVDQNALLQHLLEKDFSQLYKKLTQLRSIATKHEPHIKVPDIMGLKHSDQETPVIEPKIKQRSIQTVQRLIAELQEASLPILVTEIQDFIKKFAPKEVKNKENKSGETIPPAGTPDTTTPSATKSQRGGVMAGAGAGSYYPYDDYYQGDYYNGSSPYDQSYQQSSSAQGAQQMSGKQQKKAALRPQKAAGQKTTASNDNQMIDTLAQNINELFNEIVSSSQQSKEIKVIDTYLTTKKSPNSALNLAFEDIRITCKQAVKKVKQLNAKLAKQPETDKKRYQKQLRASFDQALLDAGLTDMQKKVKDIKSDDIPKNKREHLEYIDKVKSACNAVSDALSEINPDKKTEMPTAKSIAPLLPSKK